jgi:hypothetical protein
MDFTILTKAIQGVIEVEQAGCLSDLKLDLSEQRRGGPRDDLKRYPHHRGYIDYIAREASELLDVPYSVCFRATMDVVLPDTRQQIALRTLGRYMRRLRGAG